jgi:hypothetical protein
MGGRSSPFIRCVNDIRLAWSFNGASLRIPPTPDGDSALPTQQFPLFDDGAGSSNTFPGMATGAGVVPTDVDGVGAMELTINAVSNPGVAGVAAEDAPAELLTMAAMAARALSPAASPNDLRYASTSSPETPFLASRAFNRLF